MYSANPYFQGSGLEGEEEGTYYKKMKSILMLSVKLLKVKPQQSTVTDSEASGQRGKSTGGFPRTNPVPLSTLGPGFHTVTYHIRASRCRTLGQ